jgi:hypothetical protein
MRGKLPLALEDQPEPDEVLQFYIDAFVILSDTRKKEEVISLSDIFIYADSISEDRLEFAKIIMEGDRAFLAAKQEKAELNNGPK